MSRMNINNANGVSAAFRSGVIVFGICVMTAAGCAVDDPATSSDETGLPSEQPASQSDESTNPSNVAVQRDGQSHRVFVAAIQANAGTACPGGFVCLYQNSDRGGAFIAVPAGGFVNNFRTDTACPGCTNGIHGNDGTFNDQMSSWENRTGRRYCWYFNAGPEGVLPAGTGEVHTMGTGVIQNVLARENDQASALGPC